jgi:hypothetical protein
MIPSYCKVFALGDRHTAGIFDHPVEITEKLDGSQFAFGKLDGQVLFRSKGTQLFVETADKLFKPAVSHIFEIQEVLPEGMFFYGETLCRPKHNTLNYASVPKNHVALFAGLFADGSVVKPGDVRWWADKFEVDYVPVLHVGLASPETVVKLLENESYLKGAQIEGVVVKNFYKELMLGGKVYPFVQGKFVSEKFKEVHRAGWTGEHTARGRWEDLKYGYKTEARWDKAIQHLREVGALEDSPRDIGKIIKEIQRDIEDEEQENIKEVLWNEFGKEVTRVAVGGFPEYYKNRLLNNATAISKDE